MKESRRKQIESLLAERRSISMHELCEALNVSMNTVRADVSSLVREGVVEKVYGGIVLKQPEEIRSMSGAASRKQTASAGLQKWLSS